MGEQKGCSRNDCPTTNVLPKYTTNCGNCNAVIHLMCIGINRKAKEVQFHQNIKIVCNNCVNGEFQLPKPKSTSTATPAAIAANANKQTTTTKSSNRQFTQSNLHQ